MFLGIANIFVLWLPKKIEHRLFFFIIIFLILFSFVHYVDVSCILLFCFFLNKYLYCFSIQTNELNRKKKTAGLYA